MPLVTKITRNGKIVKVPWDDHTLNCFLSVGLSEGDPELWDKLLGDTPEDELTHVIDDVEYEKPVNFWAVPVYYLQTAAPLWKEGRHVVKRPHQFAGETLAITFKRGDVLEMHREYK